MTNFGCWGGGSATVSKFLPIIVLLAGELECLSDFCGELALGVCVDGSRTILCLEDASLSGPNALSKAASTSVSLYAGMGSWYISRGAARRVDAIDSGGMLVVDMDTMCVCVVQ